MEYIKYSGCGFIDAGEGGRFISGTKVLCLQEFVDCYIRNYGRKDRIIHTLMSNPNYFTSSEKSTIKENADKCIQAYKDLSGAINQGISEIEAALENTSVYPEQSEKLYTLINTCNFKIQKFEDEYDLFRFAVLAAKYRTIYSDVTEKDSGYVEKNLVLYKNIINLLD